MLAKSAIIEYKINDYIVKLSCLWYCCKFKLNLEF